MNHFNIKSWQEISKDPTSAQVLQIRINEVRAAESSQLIGNRISYLCDLARDKDVLDVGIVEHTIDAIHSDTWLHKNLSKVSKSCLGVDILEEDIEHLKKMGFNAVCLDITHDTLDRQFDLIICGEVLEHLETPGYLFKNARKMLKSEGKLIISVPNPWYAGVVINSIFKGFYYLDNVDHIAWFDPCTICELGHKNGLFLKCFHGIAVQNSAKLTLKAKAFFSLMSLLIFIGFRPNFFAKSIIYEFVLIN